jgi:hypothetical protein
MTGSQSAESESELKSSGSSLESESETILRVCLSLNVIARIRLALLALLQDGYTAHSKDDPTLLPKQNRWIP